MNRTFTTMARISAVGRFLSFTDPGVTVCYRNPSKTESRNVPDFNRSRRSAISKRSTSLLGRHLNVSSARVSDSQERTRFGMSTAFSNGGHGGFSVADFLRRLASFNVVLLLNFEWRPRKAPFQSCSPTLGRGIPLRSRTRRGTALTWRGRLASGHGSFGRLNEKGLERPVRNPHGVSGLVGTRALVGFRLELCGDGRRVFPG
jgi:hypothetical protein